MLLIEATQKRNSNTIFINTIELIYPTVKG